METSRERIAQRWRQLTEEFEPKIAEARQEVEEAEAEFSAARERRNEAVDRHKRLVDQYNDRWTVVGNPGGGA